MEYCCFCGLLIFEKNISEIPSMSNSLDPDQVQQNIWSGLDLNCLQRLSSDITSKQS